MSLSSRQEYILGLLIRTYISDGDPVGSKTLVSRYSLSVSSATVRNELSALDELGYLQQLHTSAGRIPTEEGYRYFVQRLLGEYELPTLEKQMIQHQFHQARLDLDQWMRLATAVLARTSLGASFITTPRPRQTRFKHVQLISTQGRLVLMVLVMYGGDVKQQMLTLAESLTQIRLTQAADRINSRFDGLSADEIEVGLRQLEWTLEQEVTSLIIDLMRRDDARVISDVYRAGIVNIMEDDATRPALKVLEERSLLANVITGIAGEEKARSGVQVIIGGDGRWEELRNCTIILGRYGVDEDLMGEVAVIGSTRMPYGRNISAVRYVADLMTGFIADYYAGPQMIWGGSAGEATPSDLADDDDGR